MTGLDQFSKYKQVTYVAVNDLLAVSDAIQRIIERLNTVAAWAAEEGKMFTCVENSQHGQPQPDERKLSKGHSPARKRREKAPTPNTTEFVRSVCFWRGASRFVYVRPFVQIFLIVVFASWMLPG
ncbi:uncharacterized protein CLUP02_12290 [Colletotrichum lupini]|uniref:Uncharacterized protein n=1 Tax=Colletotrichum lupini TaxID=145971 RepID=A0A9Q8T075_9PEZI|nr:uncharacterized protein CLUP02_12290 [Colletotrichum lupini]UQC86788.1 hypothetical protein CLUP02_12290 [Colletotrichum lupini]